MVLDMLDKGSGSRVAGKKRKASKSAWSSSNHTPRGEKQSDISNSSSASTLEAKANPGLRLCLECTDEITDEIYTDNDIDESNCISCELITNALPGNTLQEIAEYRRPRLRFRNIRTSLSTTTEIRLRDSNRLLGTLHTDTHPETNRIEIPEVVDFKTATAWLDNCKRTHGIRCDQRELSLRHSTSLEVILVDVNRDCIVIATTASRYFALSYVWGQAITTTTTTQNMTVLQQPGSLRDELILPKTVADAILLTREMGVDYLWVDSLCIIQDSPKKHRDIANMDVIYSQAELTIVALGGRDANFGLPGVKLGTRNRRTTSRCQGRYVLSLELPWEKTSITWGTTYASRGWTFQELLLSKRVLYVNEHQVNFQCNASVCSESFSNEKRHQNMIFGFGSVDLWSHTSLSRDLNRILDSYSAMVLGYTTCRLSFQTDIENAFAGISSIVEHWCEQSPVIHGMMSSLFAYSMFWLFSPWQDYYSSYSESELGRRRTGFPSWSWVGWTAVIKNVAQHQKGSLPFESLMANIEITRHGNKTTSPPFNVSDRSANEGIARPVHQKIKLGLEPLEGYKTIPSLHVLGFEAQRTEWMNFNIDSRTSSGHIIAFKLPGATSACGILSNAPNEEISIQVIDHAGGSEAETAFAWSIVRLYRLKLSLWEHPFQDTLQQVLDAIEVSGGVDNGFAENFRKRLQRSKLLYVLLIRRQGQYWERIGSGLMFARDWPSTSKRAKRRAYKERIVLI
ncbi:heterokaryon incompatibility protein-domain-containing protein [Lophiotrema nucula]|uniref:Heterokaryon incompatibility protein-domain-containing protein n=1 Tax=Lophiotrema nucula TaxID=690887 RepID=A0A6A5ZMW9_9PLEO|nr:heterokaryon incompatibility protein-domain-containing protein [Lophiotrema nucula]